MIQRAKQAGFKAIILTVDLPTHGNRERDLRIDFTIPPTAAAAGFRCVMVSNHGGQQLDHSPAPIEVAESIIDWVRHEVEVVVDGGIRRGTDVLKALALGATAVGVGRAYLYGLAAGGLPGVRRALEILQASHRCWALLTARMSPATC